MNGASCVANDSLDVFARFLARLKGGFQVARVVERIEDSENVHPVTSGALDESGHNVVRKAGVLHYVLAAHQHHMRCLWRAPLDFVQPIKGVLAQEAQAGVDGGSSPSLQGAESEVVQQADCRQHLRRSHASGRQRLVSVSQDRIVKYNGIHIHKM